MGAEPVRNGPFGRAGRSAFSVGFCSRTEGGPARRTAPFPGSLVRTGGRTGCSGPMAFAETVVWNGGRGPLRSVVRGWSFVARMLPGNCLEVKPGLRADRPNDFSFRGPDCLGVSARISARVPVAAFRAGRWPGRKRSRCRFLPRPCRRESRHLTDGWL